MKKKRGGGGASWGVDAHKVVQLMMGQLHSTADNNNNNSCSSLAAMNNAADDEKTTLDLLGGESSAHAGVAAASRPISADNGGTSTDFLELLVDDDPEQPRLPSDWKKCLDLKVVLLLLLLLITCVMSATPSCSSLFTIIFVSCGKFRRESFGNLD
jgi:hypothetical protein